jgi:hypothetical protein
MMQTLSGLGLSNAVDALHSSDNISTVIAAMGL